MDPRKISGMIDAIGERFCQPLQIENSREGLTAFLIAGSRTMTHVAFALGMTPTELMNMMALNMQSIGKQYAQGAAGRQTAGTTSKAADDAQAVEFDEANCKMSVRIDGLRAKATHWPGGERNTYVIHLDGAQFPGKTAVIKVRIEQHVVDLVDPQDVPERFRVDLLDSPHYPALRQYVLDNLYGQADV